MSKPAVTNKMFEDEQGLIFAVRKDYFNYDEAVELAKENLKKDEVILTEEYRYMFFGFGQTVDMDERVNDWWITDRPEGRCSSIWAFR